MRLTRWMRARNNSSIKSLVLSEMSDSASSRLGKGNSSRSPPDSFEFSSNSGGSSSLKLSLNSGSGSSSYSLASTSVSGTSRLAVSGSSSTSTGGSTASSSDLVSSSTNCSPLGSRAFFFRVSIGRYRKAHVSIHRWPGPGILPKP